MDRTASWVHLVQIFRDEIPVDSQLETMNVATCSHGYIRVKLELVEAWLFNSEDAGREIQVAKCRRAVINVTKAERLIGGCRRIGAILDGEDYRLSFDGQICDETLQI